MKEWPDCVNKSISKMLMMIYIWTFIIKLSFAVCKSFPYKTLVKVIWLK